MKKIIALACVAAVGVGAFALDLSVGARGNFNLGLGTTLSSDVQEGADSVKEMADSADGTYTQGGNIGGGFGIYANVGIVDLGFMTLGVQPEFDMNFNNGYHYKATATMGGTDYTTASNFSFATIDIPVLVTADIPLNDTIKLGFGIGPYLSIPVGLKMVAEFPVAGEQTTVTYPDGDITLKAKMNFGLAIDANAGFKVGPGNIVADVRYLLDFTPTKVTTYYKGNPYPNEDDATGDYLTRRALTIGIGYEVKFSF